MLNKAVFIDRDGTIIYDHGYTKDPNNVNILDGAKEAIKLLRSKGFMIFIVTNQSGVARGMLTISDVDKVNKKLLSMIGNNLIDEILICTHGPDAKCSCRKPGTALVEKAAKEYKIDLTQSFSIGDKNSDKELGIKMGGTGIKLGEDGIKTLLDAAKQIIGALNK